MLKVFVSMGKQMPRDKSIVEDTEEIAKLLAKYGCTMVQTGAKLGLMGIAVDEFEKYSDELVMITPEQFKSDLEKHTCKQHLVVEFESDRMKAAIKNFDLAIILPGGMGTFAEFAYFNEVCKSGESNAKVVLVNSKGYYNKLLKFFKQQMKFGFTNPECLKFEVAKTPHAVENILQGMIAEKHNQMYQENLRMAKLKAQQEEVLSASDEQTEPQAPKSGKLAAKKSASKSTSAKDTAKTEAKPTGKKEKPKPTNQKAKASDKAAKANSASVKVEAEKSTAEKTKTPKPAAKKATAKTDKKSTPAKTKSTKSATAKSEGKSSTVKAKSTTAKKTAAEEVDSTQNEQTEVAPKPAKSAAKKTTKSSAKSKTATKTASVTDKSKVAKSGTKGNPAAAKTTKTKKSTK